MIRIDSLKVRYKDMLALDIDRPIKIEEGSRVGVIGSNGAGKTTLVKALIGLKEYEGSFSLGVPYQDVAVHLQDNMYQDAVPVRTIMELILNQNLEHHKLASRLIEEFSFGDCLNKKFSKLSGGEQQKMTLILVLARDAKLLFFDEVTTGLDFQNRENLMELLRNWEWRKDQTIIMISHYYKELEAITDKIMILDKGHVIDYGNTDDLFRKYCGEQLFIVEDIDRRLGGLNRSNVGEIKDSLASDGIDPQGGISIINNSLMIKSQSKETSRIISNVLIDKNLNYRLTGMDIEVLYTVAKERYYEQI